MDYPVHVAAFIGAVAGATLLVNLRLALSSIAVVVLCLARGMSQSGVFPAGEPRSAQIPEQARAALREGNALYESFGWKTRALIALASVFSRGHFAQNCATISLCLVGGFYHSVKPIPDGGVGTDAMSWTQEAGTGLGLAFGVDSFSRFLAATFIGSMTDADTARLFKSYFEIRSGS